jgi:hypothetical protein
MTWMKNDDTKDGRRHHHQDTARFVISPLISLKASSFVVMPVATLATMILLCFQHTVDWK